MLRHLATGVLSLLLLATAFGPASAERRVALVIGNSAYQNTVPLKNPSNDASDMADKLRQLGFEVIDGTDLSKREMEKRIRAFADKLVGADVGLFFYAGHGLQVDGRNFLAPIDATLKSDTDLDFEAIELDLVLKQLERNSRVSLVFLDACRDNPLAVNLAMAGRSLSVGRGLAHVEKAVGMMIAFATQPGNVALDGHGRNSPFTTALLRHIDSQGSSINDVMIKVRRDVLDSTNGRQVPWENSSLTGQFYFAPEELEETDTTAEIAALRAEIERLKAAQNSGDESQELAALEQKLEDEMAETPEEKAPSRVIAVEPAAAADEVAQADEAAEPEEIETANLAPEVVTDAEAPAAADEAPVPPEPVDQAALTKDIQAKLKDLGCYTGGIDGDWGRGTSGAVEGFNEIADLDLNANEAEQETLDALAAWEGEKCPAKPAKTIVHQKTKPSPAKTQTRTKKTYAKPKKTYTKPQKKAQQAAPKGDIATDTVKSLLRPNQ